MADIVDFAPQYIMSIENKGQHPSFQVFYELITLFNISVHHFSIPISTLKKAHRRQLETVLNSLDENDLIIIEATAKGICEAKNSIESNYCKAQGILFRSGDDIARRKSGSDLNLTLIG